MSEFQEGKKYEKLHPFSDDFRTQADKIGSRHDIDATTPFQARIPCEALDKFIQ
jgi:hypothetical protein